MSANQNTTPIKSKTDVVVVGAGFSGLYLIKRFRDMGLGVQVFEAGTDVGGTWYWNRYPGARCDSDSIHYSYSWDKELEQEWTWSEKFSPQPEILQYLNHVADKHNLRDSVKFNARVKAATFDDATSRWTVTTEAGDEVSSRYFIMATGCLSSANMPDIKGADSFKGDTYHTGHWPHEGVDFTGKRVGVIGTGSSAIQAIPLIAAEADHLHVFQRSAQYTIPAFNGPLPDERIKYVKENYDELRHAARYSPDGMGTVPPAKGALDVSDEEREAMYMKGWQTGGFGFARTFNDTGINKEANDTAVKFVHDRIDEIVKDPEVARKLKPTTYPIFTKRICVDTDYYATYNRENVTLVDLTEAPITEITAKGVRTEAQEYELDAIVFATGFDAMTGSILRVDIRGAGGQSLRDAWEAGPRTYLGLMTHGFPNMFLITGPGSPSVLSNMTTSIEQHVEFVTDFIGHLDENNVAAVDADLAEQDKWVAHVNEVANYTLHPTANSWYMGANIPGKPRIFMPYMGGVGAYRQLCEGVANDNYKGFVKMSETSAAAE